MPMGNLIAEPRQAVLPQVYSCIIASALHYDADLNRVENMADSCVLQTL